MSWIADRDGLRLVGDRHFSDLEFQELLSALRNTKQNNPARICDELERDLENSFICRDTIWRLSKWCHWRGKNAQDIARRIGNLLFGRYPQPRFLDQKNRPIPNPETAQTRYEEWIQSVVRPSPPDPISVDTLYNSITQLVVNSESISWSRLYYYLVAVSLLTVAWVGLFTAESCSVTSQFLSIFIPPTGILISVLWRGLGKRSRAFLNLYLDLGFKFEIGDDDYEKFEKLRQDETTQDSSLYDYLKKLTEKRGSILPFTQTEMKTIELKKERATWRFYTSTWIFKAVTTAFIALFCLMWILSIYSFIFLLITHVKNTQFLRCIFTHFCH